MAGALVGGAFLSASLQLIFDKVASRDFVDFFKGRKLNDGLLKKLKITLLSVHAVLDDAEEKQINNINVGKWLDELKDAVYDAEDLLDEISTEALKWEMEAAAGSQTTRVRKFFTSLNPFNEGFDSKLEEILERLEFMASQKDMLGLREGVVAVRKPSRKFESSSLLLDEPGVYGRDEDKESIITLLQLDDDNPIDIGVVAIVGMGGAGKTTLAQLVYNHKRMDELFDLKVWICVSEDFDVFRITKMALEAVTMSTCGLNDLNVVQMKLKESLMGRKFLLVLDDVWNQNYADWDRLRVPFIVGARGSRILVTTRNESVASIMCTAPVHRLRLLKDEDCWSLFARHAFSNRDLTGQPCLVERGKEIAKKCKGLPLAAKALGGVLRSKTTLEEWDQILKSDIWDSPDNESNVIPALRVSYLHLPSHLKHCFAYCSIFPKDYEYNKEVLIQLWMAENLLLQSSKGKTMEEVGNQYFDDLVSRSFFQQSHSSRLRYIMHDLVNDLAKSVSGKFSFWIECKNSHGVPEKTRYLSYFQTRHDNFQKFEGIYRAKHLRTFLPLNLHPDYKYHQFHLSNKVLHDLLPMLRHLRVLSLVDYRFISELPESIGDLKKLRYLDLSRLPMRKLPDSTGILYNLQTLKLSDCKSLLKLPSDLCKLKNLCHLYLAGTNLKQMPPNMAQLKCLQTLCLFSVGKQRGTSIRELSQLNDLRGRLSILELQNVIHLTDAWEARLKEKKQLEELRLEWSTNCGNSEMERTVLEKLQPHTNLKKLTIENYSGTTFPNWVADQSLSNIVHIRLSNCKYCISLPPLGQLHSLKDLSLIGLHGIVTVGQEFHGGDFAAKPFRSLATLRFEDMLEWEKWSTFHDDYGDGAFPLLQELYIKECPNLVKDLPNNLPSLTKLVISGCRKLLASLPRSPNLSELQLGYCDKFLLQELPPKLQRLKLQGLTQFQQIKSTGAGLKQLRIYDSLSLSCFPTCSLSGALTTFVPERSYNLEFPVEVACQSLKILIVENSRDSLKSIPLDYFPNLEGLCIKFCTSLECFSASGEVPSLSSLHIWGCPKFQSFPDGGLRAPNLAWFRIGHCRSLKSLPEKMHALLPALEEITIIECPELVSFPEGGLPSSLNNLSIYHCAKLIANRAAWNLRRLNSLKYFCLSVKTQDINSLPEEGLLPTTLTNLAFYKCPYLISLNGKGLRELINLEKLVIGGCSNIQRLPDEGLPISLSILEIRDCPLLKQRCQLETGEDWRKISHIPCIQIDDKMIP